MRSTRLTSEGKKAPFKAAPRKVVGRAPIFVRTNFFLDQLYDARNLAPMGYFSEDACQRLTQVFGENCGSISAVYGTSRRLSTNHACALSYNRPPRDYQARPHAYFTGI